ncbi:MAG: hypothetical protein ACYDAG_08225 [Chloroflexota bacterium]
MSATTAAPAEAAPLSRLTREERARVIATLTEQLPPTDAVAVLTALAGSRVEVIALPRPLQRQVQQILLQAFPPGLNGLIVSSLSIALVPTASWLPEAQAKINARGIDELARQDDPSSVSTHRGA